MFYGIAAVGIAGLLGWAFWAAVNRPPDIGDVYPPEGPEGPP